MMSLEKLQVLEEQVGVTREAVASLGFCERELAVRRMSRELGISSIRYLIFAQLVPISVRKE